MRKPNNLKTFILKNKAGAFAKITNLGGIIMELHVPTKDGHLRDVVLGFDNPEDYITKHPYFGAITGRYANRIAQGQFSLNGEVYHLTKNEQASCLHGGANGFNTKIWTVTSVSKSHIVLHIKSEEGDEGFPGELDVRVKYMLDNDNQLLIDYRATTTKPTVINMSNHSFFNLDGAGNGAVLNHDLHIDADYILAVDTNLIPESDPMKVDSTPFDFKTSKKIGSELDANHPQLKIGRGYDHTFVLNNHTGRKRLVASAQSSDKQISMNIKTTEPGMQLYLASDLNLVGKLNKTYSSNSGFCLETQHFPDSPNRCEFPSVVLNPGEEYVSQTIYAFL